MATYYIKATGSATWPFDTEAAAASDLDVFFAALVSHSVTLSSVDIVQVRETVVTAASNLDFGGATVEGVSYNLDSIVAPACTIANASTNFLSITAVLLNCNCNGCAFQAAAAASWSGGGPYSFANNLCLPGSYVVTGDSPPLTLRIENNTIVDPAPYSYLLLIDVASRIIFYNNIVLQSATNFQIAVFSGTAFNLQVTHHYNDVSFSAAIHPYTDNFGDQPLDATDISPDPLFVGSGVEPYRLQSGSPARLAGYNFAGSPVGDLVGTTRPDPPSMGALEDAPIGAAVYYVSPDGSNTWPFDTVDKAATSLKDLFDELTAQSVTLNSIDEVRVREAVVEPDDDAHDYDFGGCLLSGSNVTTDSIDCKSTHINNARLFKLHLFSGSSYPTILADCYSIEGCKVGVFPPDSSLGSGVVVSNFGAPADVLIVNNLFYAIRSSSNNAAFIISMGNPSGQKIEISNNTFDGFNYASGANASNGVYIYIWGTGVIDSPSVFNNIVTGPDNRLVFVVEPGVSVFDGFFHRNNNVYPNAPYYDLDFTYHRVDGEPSPISMDASEFSLDPLYIGLGNEPFSLQNTSPCIKTGLYLGSYPVDILGAIRQNPPCIGAYEVVVAATIYYLNHGAVAQNGLTPATGMHTYAALDAMYDLDKCIVEIVNNGIVDDSTSAPIDIDYSVTIRSYDKIPLSPGNIDKPEWKIGLPNIYAIFRKSVTIEDILLVNIQVYVVSSQYAKIILSRNVFRDESNVYVELSDTSTLAVENNLFVTNVGLGVSSLEIVGGSGYIVNNLFYNSDLGITINSYLKFMVLNNIFLNNAQYCVYHINGSSYESSPNTLIDYNITYNYGIEEFSGDALNYLGTHNIRNVDPLLENPVGYDFVPKKNSPVIRNGIAYSVLFPFIPLNDFNNNTRTANVTEIGPYALGLLPDFTGIPLIGKYPLKVKFTDESTVRFFPNWTYPLFVSAYFWNFGDGVTSTERNPVHIYMMPGSYTVSLTITDDFGASTTIIKTFYINVYDFDYTGGTHVPYTSKCFRLAQTANQGVSVTEYGGERWIWPTAYVGTCKGYTEANDTVSLVMDNFTGKFYRVGISDLWKDRLNWPYGGYDIPCRLKLKEQTGEAGEFEEIEHVESHIHIRPYWEDNRNKPGFNSDGFVDGFEMDLQMYENGEPTTPSAKIQNVPRYGDYVYRRREEARRLQMEILTNASSWRIVRIQQHMLSIDKKSGPLIDNPVEPQFQREFRTPYFWISRDKSRPLLNRATGRTCTGTYDLLLAGPDMIAKSAIAFAPADSLSDTIADLSSDFTVAVWLNGIVGYPCVVFSILKGVLNLTLSVSAAGYIRLFDGVNLFTAPISWIGAGWVYVAWQRDGNYVRFFENGVQSTYQTLTDHSLVYGGTVSMPVSSTVIVFDPRIIPRAISADALLYYYQKVLKDYRNEVLPIVR
jgi:PKD repeat protein